MRIRAKIIWVFLPLLLAALTLSQLASYYRAVNGVTRVAQGFLNFKARELKKYAESQWNLLTENNFQNRDDMIAAAKEATAAYAKTIILSDSEIIFAVDDAGNLLMSTSPLELPDGEREALAALLALEEQGMQQGMINGEARVFRAFYFTPFGWYLVLSEAEAAFYEDAQSIGFQTLITLIAAGCLSAILLVLLARHITVPLGKVAQAMEKTIASGDLSSRVEVEFRDETGLLAQAFNLMMTELEGAYGQIKKRSFEAILAGKKEQRIRNIFQKYVPQELIDQFFASPESMLAGENRPLAILFSDIRNFTAISEFMPPEEVVNSLNRYFSDQVDSIMNRNGIVDKYIGDGIMAFWGAPARHEDDPLQSVLAAFDMIDAVEVFNRRQRELGKREFKIGVGINYGNVTVGNIGSERKMDYTVIGDAVNLASRMEGLTKTYKADILISGYLYDAIRDRGGEGLPAARLLDTAAVKGKTQGVRIYEVKRRLQGAEEEGWGLHNQGMELYYARDFAGAEQLFGQALGALPGDYSAELMRNRSAVFSAKPPPDDWRGIETIEQK